MNTATALADDLAIRVRHVTELAAEQADTLATADRLPADLVGAAQAAGLYRLCLPGEIGGLRVPLTETVAALAALAYANGSLGWCLVVANVSASLLARIDEAEARHIAADPEHLCIAGGFPATGHGQRMGDAYAVSGQWGFASGCTSATWLLGGMMTNDDPPRGLVGFFPAEQATIIPNWDVTGLCATGSHDVAVNQIIVPTSRTTPLIGGPRWSNDPVTAIPFFALGSMLAAVPLGIAERALDELVELARAKTRMGQQQSIANDPAFQGEFAAVRGKLNAARSYLIDRTEALWRTATEGEVTPAAQAGIGLAAGVVADAATDAVRFAHHAAGTSSIRGQHILARCLNDVLVTTTHVAFSPAVRRGAGRSLLGLPPM